MLKMIKNKTKISLGAGAEVEEGDEWINLDLVDMPGIDLVYNLVFLPLPFDDEQFIYVKAKDIFEHFPAFTPDWKPFIPTFVEEIYRILKPGGELFIQTPGHKAEFAWTDPTHTRTFTKDTFSFFDPNSDFGRSSGYISTAKFDVSVKELDNGNLQVRMVKV